MGTYAVEFAVVGLANGLAYCELLGLKKITGVFTRRGFKTERTKLDGHSLASTGSLNCRQMATRLHVLPRHVVLPRRAVLHHGALTGVDPQARPGTPRRFGVYRDTCMATPTAPNRTTTPAPATAMIAPTLSISPNAPASALLDSLLCLPSDFRNDFVFRPSVCLFFVFRPFVCLCFVFVFHPVTCLIFPFVFPWGVSPRSQAPSPGLWPEMAAIPLLFAAFAHRSAVSIPVGPVDEAALGNSSGRSSTVGLIDDAVRAAVEEARLGQHRCTGVQGTEPAALVVAVVKHGAVAPGSGRCR